MSCNVLISLVGVVFILGVSFYGFFEVKGFKEILYFFNGSFNGCGLMLFSLAKIQISCDIFT